VLSFKCKSRWVQMGVGEQKVGKSCRREGGSREWRDHRRMKTGRLHKIPEKYMNASRKKEGGTEESRKNTSSRKEAEEGAV